MFASQAKECGVELVVTSGESDKKMVVLGNSNSNIFNENDVDNNPATTRILFSDTIFMDRFKMDQVLRNLISNALKFTPKGGMVTVGVSFIPNFDPRSSTFNTQEMVVKPSSQYSCYRAALSCQNILCCIGMVKGKKSPLDIVKENDVEKQSKHANSEVHSGLEKYKSSIISSSRPRSIDVEKGSLTAGRNAIGGVTVGDIALGDDKNRKRTYDSIIKTSSKSGVFCHPPSLDTFGIHIGDSDRSISEIRSNRSLQNGSTPKIVKKSLPTPPSQHTGSSRKIIPRRSDSNEINYNRVLQDAEAAGVIHGKMRIVVTDTGAGISEENLRRLFVEVVQFNPEVLQAGGGSGLGLWITNSIVNLHEGVARAYSEGPGRGSTFTVEIDMQRKYPYARGLTTSHGSQSGLHTLAPSKKHLPVMPYEIGSHGLSSKTIGEVRIRNYIV